MLTTYVTTITLYSTNAQNSEALGALPARALHWGLVEDAATLSDTLVELGAKQVVAMDKGCLVLTNQGAVYSIDSSKGGSGEIVPVVSA